MTCAVLPIPPEENERLLSILDYEVLDTINEVELDKLTELTASIFHVPIALITIVDQNRQWFKSNFGLSVKETERSISFCQFTIMDQDVFEVKNALADTRFALNPLVNREPYIRYYCGAPLTNEKGYRMGSLAIIDRVPRELDDGQKQTLQLLAQQVINHFELKRKSRELEKEKLLLEERVAQRTQELEKNVQELREREEAFRQSEKRLKEAQKLAKLGGWEYKLASDQLTISDSMYLLLHTSKEKHPLTTLAEYYQFVHPEDVMRLKEEFRRFVETDDGNEMEYRLLLEDGTVKHIISVAGLEKEADGTVCKVWGTSQDITERKRFEQSIREYSHQLESYSRELEKANASKDKFFSIIAHDLQSPVNGVVGSANLLVNHLPQLSPEETVQFAEGIYKSATHLQKLLKNLLEWASSQTGVMKFNPTPTHLKQLADETVALLNDNAQKKDVHIANTIAEGVVLEADENMLHSILRNLLSNAIKFSKVSGTITLSCQDTPKEVIIQVKDTGIGMNKAVQEQLFRIDSKHTTPGTANEKGTGLGLLLCKEFVEKHGGYIEVASEEGRGSTFTVTLPKEQTSTSQPLPADNNSSPHSLLR